jgi:hypothetical protein
MPRPRTKITITLEPHLYEHALQRATARLLTVDDYLTQRLTAALQQDYDRTTNPVTAATPVPEPATATKTVISYPKTGTGKKTDKDP